MSPREVAAAAGISADTVRHYERRGLIPPALRTSAGYRRYPANTVARIANVRRALAIGFSINDLAAIFRDRDNGRAPCRKVRGILADRLSTIDGEIASLVTLKTEMTTLLQEWDAKLSATPPNAQARLLDCVVAKTDRVEKRAASKETAG